MLCGLIADVSKHELYILASRLHKGCEWAEMAQVTQKANLTAAAAAERLAVLDAQLAASLEANQQLQVEKEHATATASLLTQENERLRASLPLQYTPVA